MWIGLKIIHKYYYKGGIMKTRKLLASFIFDLQSSDSVFSSGSVSWVLVDGTTIICEMSWSFERYIIKFKFNDFIKQLMIKKDDDRYGKYLQRSVEELKKAGYPKDGALSDSHLSNLGKEIFWWAEAY